MKAAPTGLVDRLRRPKASAAGSEAGSDRARTPANGLRQWIARLWAIGTRGQPPVRARRIALSNQVALLGTAATLGYQAYYLTDLSHYLAVFGLNLPLAAAYLSALPLNHVGQHTTARNVVLATAYVQLFAVTALISTAAGVHLFYFSLAASLGMLFPTRKQFITLLLMALAGLLYVVCHHAFAPGSTPIAIPGTTSDVMYAASVAGTVLLTGGLTYLFRLEIDRAESALTESNCALERLTLIDPVTGLANRRALDEYLASEWRRLEHRRESLSVLLLDLDYFKEYNDRYGHLAGDACLQRVAGALGGATRRGSALVARYGGEEFVIVLRGSGSAEDAADAAEQARASVRGLGIRHEHSEVAAVVTVSVGVAHGRPDGLEACHELLHRADKALYAAKRAGRNRVAHWEALQNAGSTASRRAVADLPRGHADSEGGEPTLSAAIEV